MSRYWIIGGGKFGASAVRKLSGKDERCVITLVDSDASKLDGFPPAIKTMREDAVSFLDRELIESERRAEFPDWIVPAVPIHLAFEWIVGNLARCRTLCRIDIPESVAAILPNMMKDGCMGAYVSLADFICPDNCPEPPGKCTATGLPRKVELYRFLRESAVPSCPIVVLRSRQLAPGVGGYTPRALFDAFGEVESKRGVIVFATACLCHGVVHALDLS